MKVPTLAQLKKMSVSQLKVLSQDIRENIISVVESNGGHLASNLGVVELTIALHYVFDAPKDKLVFDVGHQCYTHKILTGRADAFSNIRKADGISGFPKQSESEFDTFDTGHASTAISLASGLMRARNLNKEHFNIISVVGDGAFLSGLSYEALNDIGTVFGKHILILNDNNMSISKNVGSLNLNDKLLYTLFQNCNIDYVGTVDGHDLEALISLFSQLKSQNKQFAVRVLTQKGKGCEQAENCPDKFHSVARLCEVEESGNYAKTFGESLIDIALNDNRVVAITAAMTDSVGLRGFSDKFPDRSYDVGICEAHAVSMAVGLATGGFKPYVCIYSSFLQRSFDQILNDACLTAQNVTFVVDHSGFVDGDGETHQGFYDISYLSLMPNMTIVAPSSTQELREVIKWSQKFSTPLAIRYPKTTLKNFGLQCDSECGHNLQNETKSNLEKNTINVSVKNSNGTTQDMEVLAINDSAQDKENPQDTKLLLAKDNAQDKENTQDTESLIAKDDAQDIEVLTSIDCNTHLKGESPRNEIVLGRWSTATPTEDCVILTTGAFCFNQAKGVKAILEDKGIKVAVQNALFVKPLDEQYLIKLNGKTVITIEDNVENGGFGSMVSEFIAKKGLAVRHLKIAIENPILRQGSVTELCDMAGFSPKAIVRKIENFFNKV